MNPKTVLCCLFYFIYCIFFLEPCTHPPTPQEDRTHFFTYQKRIKYMAVENTDNILDKWNMQSTIKRHISDFFILILTLCSQSGKVSMGWWTLNYGEGTSQR